MRIYTNFEQLTQSSNVRYMKSRDLGSKYLFFFVTGKLHLKLLLASAFLAIPYFEQQKAAKNAALNLRL